MIKAIIYCLIYTDDSYIMLLGLALICSLCWWDTRWVSVGQGVISQLQKCCLFTPCKRLILSLA